MEYLEEKDFLIAFGQNLRKLRKERGFTQEELANEIGVEISQISRIERGVIATTIGMVLKLSRAIGKEVSVLFEL